MGQPDVTFFADADALAAAVAAEWLNQMRLAQQQGRPHLVALSGGRVTKKLFQQVVQQCGAGFDPLRRVHFFWADERCLPPDDPESNYRLANELLFTPLAINPENIHRIQGELPAEEAAQRAVRELREISGATEPKLPVLDLVLLGMGEDGHVASLFPGDGTTEADVRSIYLPVHHSPKPPANRVTLGHGTIAAAREVWVLASGAGKETALRESLSLSGKTPLARVFQRRARTSVFADILLA